MARQSLETTSTSTSTAAAAAPLTQRAVRLSLLFSNGPPSRRFGYRFKTSSYFEQRLSPK
jgi:hypothetical protein